MGWEEDYLKILFEEVLFQMFSEDGQRLLSERQGEAGSTIGVPGQRRAWTGLSGSCPPIVVLRLGCRV